MLNIMAEDKTIILPDSTQTGYGFPYSGLGGGFGSFNSIADLFGLAIIASMFGWGNGGLYGVIHNRREASSDVCLRLP